MATFKEVHFLSLFLLEFAAGISVDLVIVFHIVAFVVGISVDLEMLLHRVAIPIAL